MFDQILCEEIIETKGQLKLIWMLQLIILHLKQQLSIIDNLFYGCRKH